VKGLNGQVVERDKPLDLVANCADPFCGKPIHFKERCITDGMNDYCSDRCFIEAKGGTAILAGTEQLTI
jgi:hypothetical protein